MVVIHSTVGKRAKRPLDITVETTSLPFCIHVFWRCCRPFHSLFHISFRPLICIAFHSQFCSHPCKQFRRPWCNRNRWALNENKDRISIKNLSMITSVFKVYAELWTYWTGIQQTWLSINHYLTITWHAPITQARMEGGIAVNNLTGARDE